MEKIKNEVWEKLLGYRPERNVKELILSEVAISGKSLQQVIGEGHTVAIMPFMVVLGPDGMFVYQGERITLEKWRAINPLGEFGRIVIVAQKRSTINIEASAMRISS